MSNIQNTNVDIIKSEIINLTEILDIGIIKSENVLKNRFSILFNTSPSLFKFIMKNYQNIKYDQLETKKFYDNINMMLKLITDIQESKISQYDASVFIGKNLAEQYVPILTKIPEQ